MTTALKMTNEARAAARKLAVIYDAFNDAGKRRNKQSMRLWGNLLIDAQEEVGVELYTPCHIHRVIGDEQPLRFTMSRGPDGETRLNRQA